MPPLSEFPAKACQDYTDAELIAMILAGGPTAELAMDCLFKLYFDQPGLWLQRHRLDRSAVLDAYANALMALRVQVQSGKFRAQGPLKAFFAKIFKFKCIDELRRSATNKDEDPEMRAVLEEELATLNPEELLLLEEENNEQAETDRRRAVCMEKAMLPFSDRDRKLLTDYFIGEMSLDALTKKYAFKDNRSTSSILSKLKKGLIIEINQLCKNEPQCQLLCPGGRRPN